MATNLGGGAVSEERFVMIYVFIVEAFWLSGSILFMRAWPRWPAAPKLPRARVVRR